jgi:hypothetical protein
MYLAMFLFCGTLLLSYVSSVVIVHLMNENANPWMVTLLFATTSLGIILPILEESEVLPCLVSEDTGILIPSNGPKPWSTRPIRSEGTASHD